MTGRVVVGSVAFTVTVAVLLPWFDWDVGCTCKAFLGIHITICVAMRRVAVTFALQVSSVASGAAVAVAIAVANANDMICVLGATFTKSSSVRSNPSLFDDLVDQIHLGRHIDPIHLCSTPLSS
eukprot:211919_1